MNMFQIVWITGVIVHQMFKKVRTLVTSAGKITKVTRKSNNVIFHGSNGSV